MASPIKVKICDRNSLMGLSYDWKLVKVEQANGVVVVKSEKDVLKTDTILTYLPNDYIKPIQVKILDINIVYATAEVLRLIVNYGRNIPEKLSIVYNYIKAHTKLIFRGRIHKPVTIYYGYIRDGAAKKIKDISGKTLEEISEYDLYKLYWNNGVKLRASIVTALDIFKEEGLKIRLKAKHVASGLVKVWSQAKTKIVQRASVADAIRTVYTTVTSKLKHNTNMEKATTIYYGYTTNKSHRLIKGISWMTIDELMKTDRNTDRTIDDILWDNIWLLFTARAKLTLQKFIHENEATSRIKQKTTLQRCFSINYASNNKDKNKLLFTVSGITQGVVKTKLKIKEIDNLTLKELKDNDTLINEIIYKYS